MTVRKVTISRALLVIRDHLRSIVVVVVNVMSVVEALVVVIVSALDLQSNGVSVRVRLFALFVTGRVIQPIAVSLILIAVRTGANRQQRR